MTQDDIPSSHPYPKKSLTLLNRIIMKKKQLSRVKITLMLQNDEELTANKCLSGLLSLEPNAGTLLFEESVRHTGHKRNPKLFDGEYISLVRMQNGKYKCHMKSFDPSKSAGSYELATKVFAELVTAFKRFEQN